MLALDCARAVQIGYGISNLLEYGSTHVVPGQRLAFAVQIGYLGLPTKIRFNARYTRTTACWSEWISVGRLEVPKDSGSGGSAVLACIVI